MHVLDLFCGAGGLSTGFARKGFKVLGVDIITQVKDIYHLNGLGEARVADLSTEKVSGTFQVVIGGPPCKPWSLINVRKRGRSHENFSLLGRFFEHVEELRPEIFLMENVPPAEKDTIPYLKRLAKKGYSVSLQVVRYSDYGAAIARRRLIAVGRKKGKAEEFFIRLKAYRKRPRTVREAIGHLRNVPSGAVPDHEFPALKTIHRYMDYYRTGKYGWYILDWDRPAPSFGNITKTYILHPSSKNGGPVRVISIREALLLMGFDSNYVFPEGMSMKLRYQMVADAVSPVFSEAAAEVILSLLEE